MTLQDLFKEGEKYEHEFVVTEGVYHAFQQCSNDKNRLHTDKLYAQAKGFNSKVMYGNILNAFLSYFIGECLSTGEVIIHSQEINYKQPVYLNDVLWLRAKVDGVYESVNAVTFRFQFINSQEFTVAKGKIQIGVLI